MILALILSAFSLPSVSVAEHAPLTTPVLSVTNLKRNLVAIFRVDGCTPGRSVGLFVSLTGPGPTTVTTGPCGQIGLDLTPRLFYIGTSNADGGGVALFTQPIPPGAGGRTVYSQAVDYYPCSVSNLLVAVVAN